MKQINYKIITELTEAEAVWKLLSPNNLLFDDWDFRYGYYKYFNYPLFFYTAYDKNKLVGVLPLMWNPEREYLEFFASFGYMENNSAYVKPGYEFCIPYMVQQIDKPVLLEYMHPNSEIIPSSSHHDNEYYADLAGLKDYHDFIDTYMTGDKRRNILSQCRKLEEKNIVITEGTKENIEDLIYWNKIRFGSHSSFYKRPFFEDYMRFIVSNFDTKIITASIDNEIHGAGMVVFYHDICFGISTGYNPDINNLGKYISLHKINLAIKAGKQTYAAGTGSPSWKEDFNLLKKPQFQLDIRNSTQYTTHQIATHIS